MKLGVLPLARRIADPGWLAAFAEAAERLPVESAWIFEHVVVPERYESVYPFDPTGKMPGPPDVDIPDPLQWLQHLAALTGRIRLGTALMILPLHHPLILAKRLATLDRLSGGRTIAGFGIGWLAEEYDALGIPFAERGRRADESLQIVRASWASGPTTFSGPYHSFDDVHVRPAPAQSSGVPIILGGASPAAMRRAARWADGVFLLGQDLGQTRRLLDRLFEEAVAVNRSPADFEITVDAPLDTSTIPTLDRWGVDRIVLARAADTISAWEQSVRDYARHVPPDA